MDFPFFFSLTLASADSQLSYINTVGFLKSSFVEEVRTLGNPWSLALAHLFLM